MYVCIDVNLMVSCQKGPTRHACAWQIGPFWQDTIELFLNMEFVQVIQIPSCRW